MSIMGIYNLHSTEIFLKNVTKYRKTANNIMYNALQFTEVTRGQIDYCWFRTYDFIAETKYNIIHATINFNSVSNENQGPENFSLINKETDNNLRLYLYLHCQKTDRFFLKRIFNESNLNFK